VKKILYSHFLFVFCSIYSQPISTEIPNVASPSPTVASLMKFEEIPVNNYTGIPNISIPIYSIETRSKDVVFDISLNYHPASVAVEEVASYVGLGWNLFAGGTISRTVRGYPDEFIRSETSGPKIGIYDITENKYWQFKKIYTGESNLTIHDFSEYIWDTYNRGMFDTEYDLYQFNYMGRTGRFIVKPNGSYLIVEKLDFFTEKIIVNSSYNEQTKKYTINGFTIYDEKGIRYKFDIVENQFDKTHIVHTDFLGQDPAMIDTNTSPYYNSAFHLSEIKDNNNETLVKLKYTGSIIEKTQVLHQVTNQVQHPLAYASLVSLKQAHGTLFGLPGSMVTTSVIYQVNSKKLKSIEIVGKAKINFGMSKGRDDYNMLNASEAMVLKSIQIKNSDSLTIKHFNFSHNYRSHQSKSYLQMYKDRLFLSEIKETGSSSIEEPMLKYKLYYKDNVVAPHKKLVKDPWGYFTTRDEFQFLDGSTTDPDVCTTDVLEKITYPTGGSVVFNFQSNTYSYMGNADVPDFSENRQNKAYQFVYKSIQGSGNQCESFSAPNISYGFEIEEVRVYPIAPTWDNYALQDFYFEIKKNGVVVKSYSGCQTGHNCYFTIPNYDKNAQYQICLKSLNLDNLYPSGYVQILFVYKRKHPHKFIYGGGLRIGSIEYTDNDEVVKKTQYGYGETIKVNDFGGPFQPETYGVSFGSLVYPKPIYQRLYSKSIGYQSGQLLKVAVTNQFVMTSNRNFIEGISKNGASVGYKKVTVKEVNGVVGNGKKVFSYTSAIDFPEPTSTNYPYLPTRSYEYKRGLLLSEKIYASKGNGSMLNPEYTLLSESNYEYDYQEAEILSGAKVFSHDDCPFLGFFPTYDSCSNNPQCPCSVSSIIAIPFWEGYGWSKLVSKTTKNYFYQNEFQNFTKTDETFAYYDGQNQNKKIKEHTTTNSLGETLKTNYYYDNNGLNRNRIGVIKKIETRRNNELLEVRDIHYVNTFTGNYAFLPKTISVSKGTNQLESRIQYIKYDKYSNPLEIKQEDGISIVYLWGYGKSYPIAKIENTNYQTVIATLGVSDINETNIDAIDNLRNNPSFSEATITTYRYKPLIGITSITDPRGYKTTYQYDSFGRLKRIRDADGNIISETDYHYRPEN